MYVSFPRLGDRIASLGATERLLVLGARCVRAADGPRPALATEPWRDRSAIAAHSKGSGSPASRRRGVTVRSRARRPGPVGTAQGILGGSAGAGDDPRVDDRRRHRRRPRDLGLFIICCRGLGLVIGIIVAPSVHRGSAHPPAEAGRRADRVAAPGVTPPG